jgi:hypothetical protein
MRPDRLAKLHAALGPGRTPAETASIQRMIRRATRVSRAYPAAAPNPQPPREWTA